MTYELAYKRSFVSTLKKLEQDIQSRVDKAVGEIKIEPNIPRGNTKKKLKHHEKLWRYRIEDYRLIYAVYSQRQLVQLLFIGQRDKVYKRLRYRPDDPQYPQYSAILDASFDPYEEKPLGWMKDLNPEEKEKKTSLTPIRLTSNQLIKCGIPIEYHDYFISCKTEDDLLNCQVPGEYISDVIDYLIPPTVAEVAAEKNYVLQKVEDLSRYVSGELKAFLLLLDKDQENLVDWRLKGPTLVKGGPGSGKSTVAMYRVRELIRKTSSENKNVRVLFTTYTNALVDYSSQLINYLIEGIDCFDGNIKVNTLDRLARKIVSDFEGYLNIAKKEEIESALKNARNDLISNLKNGASSREVSKTLQSIRDDYLLEEFEWVIEGQGIETLGEYLNADRTGRGYGFSQLMRENVWELYENYCNFLDELGKLSWGGIRKKALEYAISKLNNCEKWDYVLVDEAQDLTPVALALCMELCKSPSGLFLTADASQSIYNKGFSWINVHESMHLKGRTRILKRNYRTTRQIALAAFSIIKKADAGDEEALNQIYIHEGTKPILHEAFDTCESYSWLADQLLNAASDLRMPLSSIAIFGPHNWMVKEAAEKLSSFGLNTTYVSGNFNLDTPSAKAMTLHSSKGLEFPIVALIYIEKDFIPYRNRGQPIEDIEKHLAKENRLLYVGMTRAMRRLFVVYRSGKKSTFLKNVDQDLWDLRSFA